MGSDKSLLGPPDHPLAARVSAALRDAGVDAVMLVGGDGPALRGFGDEWFDDEVPGSGPLGGVCTVARRRPDASLLVCACDMPGLAGMDMVPLLRAISASGAAAGTPPTVADADSEGVDGVGHSGADPSPPGVRLTAGPGADVAVYDVGGVPQWSVVALSPRASASIVGSFDDGERSMHRAMRAPALVVARLNPDRPDALRDVDRPEDLPPMLRRRHRPPR
ncbi:MAG: NTP transferase domain-containing protein [Actinobacteria bacterium]|nr:NTP transferase domain-containing protein [Actinomycetota bacterium]